MSARKRDLPPTGYLDAVRGGSQGRWRRHGRTESGGPAPAGCAVSRCTVRLALLRSDHFLSPVPDTDSSQHPGCGTRPAHGPRPPRPRLPREGLRTAQHRLGQPGSVEGTRGQPVLGRGRCTPKLLQKRACQAPDDFLCGQLSFPDRETLSLINRNRLV